MKKNKKYKAAVIGCGRIGFGFDSDPKRKYVSTHTGAYSRLRNTRLVAVCDKERKRVDECASRWGVPGRYTDLRKMLEV